MWAIGRGAHGTKPLSRFLRQLDRRPLRHSPSRVPHQEGSAGRSAAKPPGNNILRTQVGEVLIVESPAKVDKPKALPPVIASKAVLHQLTPTASAKGVDTVEANDPWAAYLSKSRPSSGPDAFPGVVQQVTQQVMAQIMPPAADTSVLDRRFQELSCQLQAELSSAVNLYDCFVVQSPAG